MIPTDAARQLRDDGFCVLPGLMEPAMLRSVQDLARDCLAGIDAGHRAKYRSEGSLMPVSDEPRFASLIAYQPALDALAALGFGDVRFSSGYVISKPPHSPALFWHQDWWGWNDPISTSGRIAQVFAFWYLTRTTRANGCLRVIPGSQRKRHPLHDTLGAHADDLAQVSRPEDRVYQPADGELTVEVEAGDLVVGDARLLHGSYPNSSDAERTLVTLWYHPDFASMPAAIQSRVYEIYRREGVDTDAGGSRTTPEDWPEPSRSLVTPLLPVPKHLVAPEPWNRIPAGLR